MTRSLRHDRAEHCGTDRRDATAANASPAFEALCCIAEHQKQQIEALQAWTREHGWSHPQTHADQPAKPSDDAASWQGVDQNDMGACMAMARKFERERYERETLPGKLADERERLAAWFESGMTDVGVTVGRDVARLLRGAKP